MSSKLNEAQNASVGMTVGCIEVLTLQPLNYCKNMVQQRRPISMNPAVMYRGVGANMVNMGGCTMIQFAVGGRLRQMVLGSDADGRQNERNLSLAEEMACGIGAGCVSALAGSPLELIMIQQQVKGGNTVATIANIVKQPLDIYRGFVGAAVREALWTCGYLSIPPVVRRTLMTEFPDQFPSNNAARIPAALLGGLFGCYMTQPFDTVKTCMQGDIERANYGSFTQSATKIWGESKLPGFYRGATFRYGRMVCAVFIMDYLKDVVGAFLYPDKYE